MELLFCLSLIYVQLLCFQLRFYCFINEYLQLSVSLIIISCAFNCDRESRVLILVLLLRSCQVQGRKVTGDVYKALSSSRQRSPTGKCVSRLFAVTLPLRVSGVADVAKLQHQVAFGGISCSPLQRGMAVAANERKPQCAILDPGM